MDSDIKKKRPPHPRANANIFEILTFGWTFKLFNTGRKRDLEINDLYTTLSSHSSSLLGIALEKKWKEELYHSKKRDRQPSLLRALFQMFGTKIMFYGILMSLLEIIPGAYQPFFLGCVIAHFDPDTQTNKSSNLGIYYGLCLFGTVMIKNFNFVVYDTISMHLGMKMRVSTSRLIYNKALRLSKTALGETTAGQVVNLLSNDVNRFDTSIYFLPYIWTGPMQTLVVSFFLWREIGVSSIFGIVLIIIFIPLQGWLGKITSEFRLKIAILTDKRVRLMNEIISGLKVIKMYTWEKPFEYLVKNVRKNEIRSIKKSKYIGTFLISSWLFHTRVALFFSIFSYVFFGNFITAQKVFVVTLYYNMLQVSMTFFFPKSITQIAELLISIKRLQSFLLYEEKENQLMDRIEDNESATIANYNANYKIKSNGVDTSIGLNHNIVLENGDIQNNSQESIELGIIISNATAKWANTQSNFSIQNINLNVKPSKLVAVIGPVGAGKSSLIQAILKELPLCGGHISVHGVVSYASQEPWLFASSVRQNIIFGSPMDEKRYSKVIQVCALKIDFEQLPYGDKTIVGERGVLLSGGQKARINLARAVYKQADIYLLDDPLSAVDTHVGKHLFEKCIKSYLKEKTCILITHQLQYLSNVDHIILMENAKILAEGTYLSLQTSGFDFTKILESFLETTISDNESKYKHVDTKRTNPHTILQSRNSCHSTESSTDELNFEHDQNNQIEIPETCSNGDISISIYSSYFSAGGSSKTLYFLLFICIFTQVLASGGDFWISFWVNLEESVFRKSNKMDYNILSATYIVSSMAHEISNPPLISRQSCIIIFAILTFSLIVVILMRTATLVSVCLKASFNLHNAMFNAIIKATMYFFNTNSTGRILNRFSKDIGAIDELLPLALLDCIQTGFLVLGIIIVLVFLNIYLMLPLIIVLITVFKLRILYLSTSRSVKRLEGVTRSPVFAHLNATIQGLTTIRAFNAEDILLKEYDNHQDLHSSAWYLFISLSRAFGFWLDLVFIMFVGVVIFSYFCTDDANGSHVGLAITQALGLVGFCQYGMRQSAELQDQMTSVERVLEYTNLPQESAFETPPDDKPPREWPQKGQIEFKNFYIRYCLNEPHVLKNLNLKIKSTEKIGIVGRTGAGKSSLISALFRLAHNEGSILIDDIDINKLGLHDLRSKISIIPQEPVLFSGTIRTNLDPFNDYKDDTLWNALKEVELKDIVKELPLCLDSKMSEGGSNFSVGQRQLICLARAIVRNNKILVLDEATANVDAKTDTLIQRTIRNKFRSCTVLTIAHRLNTVMDSDKVLVMNSGEIVEFDHPYNLLQKKRGFLYQMVKETGQDTSYMLHSVAAENYKIIHLSR
ncbi:probable multidrug resistance-associated protein lethal(2)03659 isoform X2 [Sipha flava]|nr:probable multidrug resistance-associated protein lethal(2)03659 isoform X2 [Sipha flava]